MIRVNANLFRIATACQSKEETRYYLQGVFVEPHADGGVTLATTDGHRMLVIRDETGFADESAIICLSPAALKECKAPTAGRMKLAGGYRLVIVDGPNAQVQEAFDQDGKQELLDVVAVSPKCRIDGTFPDYRGVVPQAFSDNGAPGFAGHYLAAFGEIGTDLAAHATGRRTSKNDTQHSNAMRILPGVDKNPAGMPALILWPAVPQAFGILMPVRLKVEANGVPAWFRAPIAADETAVAA